MLSFCKEKGGESRAPRRDGGHKKREGPILEPSLERSLGVVLLSHVRMRSIIDDGELNCRVRNGIGCTLSSMNAKTNLYEVLIDRGWEGILKNKPLGLLVPVS